MSSKLRNWSRVVCVTFLFGFAATATVHTQSGKPPIRDEGDAIVIENQYARLTVGKDGATRSFQDARSNTEYLDLRFPVYFMSARRGNVEFGSSRITRRGNDLDVKFGGSGIEARVRVGVEQSYFTFEVLSVNQTNLDELIFVDLPLTISERVARVQEWREHSETINVCRNDQFGVSLSSVNLTAHSRTTRYEPAAFRSSCYPRFGMVGAKVALVAGPSDRMLDLIGEMEVEQGLPHPTLGGEWGKTSREIQKSYLFVDFTEANIDRVIELAKAGGFSYILNYGGTWSKSDGKYEVNTRNFPNGLPGLKAVMDKIHAAGLKGGAHMLAGCVDKNNAYVTPVPDPRLAKDDMRILASDIGTSDTTLLLTTSPEGLPTVESYDFHAAKASSSTTRSSPTNNLKTDPPFALEGCTRGAYGTKASSHRAGSRVYHLGQRWGNVHHKRGQRPAAGGRPEYRGRDQHLRIRPDLLRWSGRRRGQRSVLLLRRETGPGNHQTLQPRSHRPGKQPGSHQLARLFAPVHDRLQHGPELRRDGSTTTVRSAWSTPATT